jgi:hypothetical protein
MRPTERLCVQAAADSIAQEKAAALLEVDALKVQLQRAESAKADAIVTCANAQARERATEQAVRFHH